MDKDKQRLIAGLFVILIFLFVLWPTPEPQASSDFAGDNEGGVEMHAIFLDDDMKPVDTRGLMTVVYERGLALLTPTDERVKYLQVTVDWDTTEVMPGFDPLTFLFDATLDMNILADNGVTQWAWVYDVSPAGAPDIASAALNGTAQWTLNLRQDLSLESEAKGQDPNVRTDFDIVMDLSWSASMYDTIDDLTESMSGLPLSLTVECYYVRGFKTVPRIS